MINQKRNKIIMIIIVFIIGLIIVGAYSLFINGESSTSMNSLDQYAEDERINLALNRLEKEGAKAEIITKVKTSDKVFGLIFKGSSDIDTNKKLLDLISESDVKATFFITGKEVMEDESFIRRIHSMGLNIGSNTLTGLKHMEEYSNEDLVKDFIKTNDIIKSLIKKDPTSLVFNNTLYTDKLLRAAYESGNEKIIDTTYVLNYQSFKNYKQVLNYVKAMEKGSIITIKISGVLDESEYEPPIKEEKPAIDKQADININVDEYTEILTESERLLNMVKWLLQAIEETNYETVFVESLNSYAEEFKPHMEAEFSLKLPTQSKNKKIAVSKVYLPPKINNSLLAYINSDNHTKEELEDLRKKNNNNKAEELHTIFTTEKSLNFSFYGVNNKGVLENVLNTLDSLDAKGTFFVTERDILNNRHEIVSISDKGHEIGIGLMSSGSKDYYIALNNILKMQTKIKDITGKSPGLVRYPYELEIEDEVLEAISSAGCRVVWHDLAVASSKLGKDAGVDDVIDNIFYEGNLFSHRGYIIYYRMDYYTNPELIGDIMVNIAENRINNIAYPEDVHNSSEYSIKTLTSLIESDKVYNYPLKSSDILDSVKDAIYPGHIEELSDDEKFNLIKDRYTGNPNINNNLTLPGFTNEELDEIDTSGVFTDDKILFLTFDDWSSDKPINHLLYILDKHDVKSSFFIRTNYMQNNPNILRAIAEAGHDVGSHTDEHLPFALSEKNQDEDDTNGKYFSLTENEIEGRQNDLLKSYEKLQEVIGDISVDGKPALTKILRPPTLAMSRAGMEIILDMGFSHIVSGDFNTRDYEETDPEILAERIVNGMMKGDGDTRTIQNGSILVMHMSDGDKEISDTPNVTAKALDIAIPILKSEGYSFGKLSDYISE